MSTENDLPLPQYILRNYLKYDDPSEDREMEEFLRAIQNSFEGINPPKDAQIMESMRQHGALNHLLESHYMRDMCQRVPKMIKRTVKLTMLQAANPPSPESGVYLREATRTYIFGFWQSTIALSRAALEIALRERLGSQGAAPKLKDLIDLARRRNLLDGGTYELAKRVEFAANDVLHRRSGSDKQAWDSLCALRGVLTHVFNPPRAQSSKPGRA